MFVQIFHTYIIKSDFLLLNCPKSKKKKKDVQNQLNSYASQKNLERVEGNFFLHQTLLNPVPKA